MREFPRYTFMCSFIFYTKFKFRFHASLFLTKVIV